MSSAPIINRPLVYDLRHVASGSRHFAVGTVGAVEVRGITPAAVGADEDDFEVPRAAVLVEGSVDSVWAFGQPGVEDKLRGLKPLGLRGLGVTHALDGGLDRLGGVLAGERDRFVDIAGAAPGFVSRLKRLEVRELSWRAVGNFFT